MEHISDISRKLADYIYHDLSPEEQSDLEKLLHEDPDLMESFRMNKQVKDYLAAKIRLEEMRSDPQLEEAERLAELAYQSASDQTVSRRISGGAWIRYAAAFAAAFAILVAVRVFVFTSTDRLFESYYKPLEASNYIQRGNTDDLYRDISDGINSYLAGDYLQSIQHFHNLEKDPVAKAEAQFFKGLSLMGLGQFPQAEAMFQAYIAENSRYLPEALWYLSLCHVKRGETERAIRCLDQLATYDGMYREDAYTLAKKLRRIR